MTLGKSVLIASLEPVRADSAAEVHLKAAGEAFRVGGWRVLRSWRSSAKGRILALIADQIRLIKLSSRVDVTYSRWHVLGLIQYAGLRLLRRPYVLEVNGTFDDIVLAHPNLRPLRWALGRMTRWEFRNASGIVAVTEGHGRWARQLAGDNVPVHVAPNGADRWLAGLRTDMAEPKYAVFVGELAPWQGIDLLLDAHRSSGWPNGVRLVVIGDGALKDKVVQHAEEHGVEYRGRLRRLEALRLMAGACVSISPQSAKHERSRMGVSPIKVAESLVLGVPVVASALPGQRELLAGAPGSRTFPPDDADALAISVREVSEQAPEVRTRVAAFGEANVLWEVVMSRVEAFCAGVIHGDQR